MSQDRRQQLEKNLEEAYQLIGELESRLLKIDNPVEQARLKDDIVQRKKLVAAWEAELQNGVAPDVVQAYLAALDKEFERRFRDVEKLLTLRMQPGKGRINTALSHFHPSMERLNRMKAALNPAYSPQEPSKSYEPDANQALTDVSAFVAKRKRVALLGAPGAGKSTTLRRLVKDFFVGGSSAPDNRHRGQNPLLQVVPIFVELNRWNDPKMGVVEFLQQEVGRHSPELARQLPDLMKNGKVWLLLDALNEMPQLRRDEKIGAIDDSRSKAIAALAKAYPDVECVLTCRVKEFAGGPEWCDLHVLNLSREQVTEFAAAYYEGDPEADKLQKDLLAELYESKSERKQKLKGLTAQPFFLVRLLEYYYSERNLPENPALLLKYSIEAAFEREIENGNMTPEEAEELQTRLGYLAFNMTDAGLVWAVKKDLATAWIFHLRDQKTQKNQRNYNEPKINGYEEESVEKILNWAEATSLFAINPDSVQFFHPLIQEFFVLEFLSRQQTVSKWFDRVAYYQFREIIPMWAELYRDLFADLQELLSHQNKDVRVNAVILLGRLGNTNIVPELITIFENDEIEEVKDWAANALGELGDQRAVEALIKHLSEDVMIIVPNAVVALGKIKDKKAIEPLVKVYNKIQLVKRPHSIKLGILPEKVILALGKIGDSKVTKFLIQVLENDKKVAVRANAAYSLALIEAKEAIPNLIKTIEDTDPTVRIAAVAALGILGDKEILHILEKIRDTDDGEIFFWGGRVKDAAIVAIDRIKAKNNLK